CTYQGVQSGCGPTSYKPLRGVLYRNLGGGKFQDVSASWSLEDYAGRTLGVAAAPSPENGRPLLAIADDETAGGLFELRGTQTRNIGIESGMATAGGQFYGGMGIDWGDYNNDGRLDLVIATYQNQGKLVLRRQAAGFEIQDTGALGMFSSLPYVAFGVKWLDFDNSGWLDLLFANGHVEDNADSMATFGAVGGQKYRQPIILYRNLRGRSFQDVSSQLAGGAATPIVGRGLAIGDYDNDGRMDALIVNNEGAPVLLHNICAHPGHWLEIRLRGVRSNSDGIGALVTAQTASGRFTRLCTTGGSYLSASDRRVHIGLGSATKARLTIQWPSGVTSSLTVAHLDRVLTIAESGSSR
ncbi:MAG TPA: CRTAC1 family protein, partial [Chthonomonadales bacterium]|nr:CRTAC1 family protein [Chthonomonadales bacterium]